MSKNSLPSEPLGSTQNSLYSIINNVKKLQERVMEHPILSTIYTLLSLVFSLTVLGGIVMVSQVWGQFLWNDLFHTKIQNQHILVSWTGNIFMTVLSLGILFFAFYAYRWSTVSKTKYTLGNYRKTEQLAFLRKMSPGVIYIMLASIFMCSVIFYAVGVPDLLSSPGIETTYSNIEYAVGGY